MFIALRQLNTKDGPVNPGDPIPSADSWSHGVQRSEVNCGNVFDLSRGVVLNDRSSPTQHKREQALLDRLPEFGKQVIPGDPVYLCVSLPIEAAPATEEPPRRKGRSRG